MVRKYADCIKGINFSSVALGMWFHSVRFSYFKLNQVISRKELIETETVLCCSDTTTV